VKFDFLGLATLTILEIAKDFIVARHTGQERLCLRETLRWMTQHTYKVVSGRARPKPCSSLKAAGMQRMLQVMRGPSRLEDLIALNALYRPGPMDLIPSFVARKHGREAGGVPTSPGGRHAERDLRHHGLPGTGDADGPDPGRLFSLGGADLLRRAMGKKKAEEMAEHRAINSAPGRQSNAHQ
jgi:DNA polymerase-3 subunit alpha